MTDKKLLKLALEALEFIPESGSMLGTYAEGKRVKAITAIKQALALDKKAENARELGLDYEPVQEPFEYWTAVEGWVKIDEVREHFDSVGCGTIYKTAGEDRVPLTAAQRKPLTDEQRQELMSKAWNEWLSRKDDGRLFAWSFSFEVEAAHGIKENT
jgi:hypothetical protein